LLREPVQRLLYRWNWKSAVLSSLLRATLFFATNLTAGLPAAFAAMRTELVFRAITSGFYGALTENFREAEPAWAATITVMILLPSRTTPSNLSFTGCAEPGILRRASSHR
jgi:hypothetical protein